MPNDDAKAAMKEAIKEWMDEQFAEFGRWSIHAILVAALGALGYYLVSHGHFNVPVVGH